MKTLAALALTLAACTTGWAQGSATTAGEVTKVDKAQARITLRHGEIKSLDMPPMTMTYKVANARLLEGVAAGDRVRFAADKIDGVYTLTALVKSP